MSQPINNNPYIDEMTSLKASSLTKSLPLGEIDEFQAGLTNLDGTSTQNFIEKPDLEDIIADDLELEHELEKEGVDEFSKFNPLKDKKQRGQNQQQQQQKRQQKKVKKKSQVEGVNQSEAESIIEDANIEDDFDSWDNWFDQAEKQKPPRPRPNRFRIVREEFNSKRSPHVWKSDPGKQWILAFGYPHGSQIVSANLYKYQNETIERAA